jgi:hypothetical protein
LVKQVEGKLCPFCRAYERVHGCQAHVKKSPSTQQTSSSD